MNAKRATASLLTLLMMLSGCLGNPENDSPMEGLEATPVLDFDFLISFQFNQSLPMGYGTETHFETNVSDSEQSPLGDAFVARVNVLGYGS